MVAVHPALPRPACGSGKRNNIAIKDAKARTRDAHGACFNRAGLLLALSMFASRTAIVRTMTREIAASLAWVRTLKLRRAFVALFAFSYLFVGFVHTLNCDAYGATGIYQVVSVASDNSSGDAQQPTCGDHCHICMAVSTPLAPQAVFPIEALANMPAVPSQFLVAQPPAADPPPPKSLT